MSRVLVLAALLVAVPASAVEIEWVLIGEPGNPPDAAANCLNGPPDCGSVPYRYYISKYEFTNAQYAEFLNAKERSDALRLYNPSMGSDVTVGGITRSGSDGSYSYAAKTGFENKPVVFVSFWDALRFANWLHNGQGQGDTETGAYTITTDGIAYNQVTRNAGASVFLPSENEWYKAAYHSPGGTYFDYPTGTDTPTGCVAPGSDAGDSANCFSVVGALTNVGAYGLSDSPHGTFDQGGNVGEWLEEIGYVCRLESCAALTRGLRGGDFFSGPQDLGTDVPGAGIPTGEWEGLGFRLAAVPEPGHALLVLTGGLVLAAARWRRQAERN